MKVKIGNKIYEASKEPILLILNDQDKKNIANMSPTAIKYCAFPDEGYTEEEIREFMKIENTPDTVTFIETLETDWIKVCVEVDRRGIAEENIVLHYEFNVEPTREEILALLESEDVGYDDRYCKFDYYRIN